MKYQQGTVIYTLSSVLQRIDIILKNYSSIESVTVNSNSAGYIDVNIDIDELKYIADILSVGKIDEVIKEKVTQFLPAIINTSVRVNLNMLSPIEKVAIGIALD